MKTVRGILPNKIKNTGSKTMLLLMGLVFISLLNFSFSENKDSLINHLQLTINNYPQDDTTKVNLLNKLSEQLWQAGVYDTAIFHAETAKNLAEKNDFKKGIASSYNNIGNIYQYQGNYPEALKNYFASLKIQKEIGDKSGIARSYNNIGLIYDYQGNYPEALKNYFASLKIEEEIGNKAGIAASFLNIGSVELTLNNIVSSKKYLDDALALAKEIGYKEYIKDTYSGLSQLDSTTGNFKDAYSNHKFYTVYKDSLFSEEKSKEIGRLEMRHEYDMTEMKQLQEEEERRKQEAAAVGRRNMLQYSGILLGLVFLFMSIFLVARKFRKIKEHRVYEQYLKIVEATLFISFLIFFEFILVLLDPYLETLTGGEPAYKLLINAILAGVIFPLHSFLEVKLKASVIKTERAKWVEEIKSPGFKTMLLLIGFVFISLFNISFVDKVDSLKAELANPKDDTTKVNLLNSLANGLMYQFLDSSFIIENQAIMLAEKIGFKTGIADAFNNLGIFYLRKGDNSKALLYHLKALEIRKKLSNKNSISASLGNIGMTYMNRGDFTNALKYYEEALEIKKEISDKNGIAIWTGNIGIIYEEQGDFPKALKYYQDALQISKELGNKNYIAAWLGNIGNVYWYQREYSTAIKHFNEALEIDKELGDKAGIAVDLGNIGIVYIDQGDLANALKYYNQALTIDKELGNKNGIARHLGNIGIVYKQQGDFALALNHFEQSLEISNELKDNLGIARNLGNIGSVYTSMGKFTEAEIYLEKSLELSNNIGSLSLETEQCEMLSHLYEITHQWKLAYNYYIKYSITKDTLFNEEKSKEIGRLEMRHEFEMAEIERKRVEEEARTQEAAAVGRRNMLQYSGISMGIFALFGLLFFVRKFNIPGWVVELAVFIPFLILFEFLLVLLDPYLENITGGEPAYKLLINALLAGLIFPLHSFLEAKLKGRLHG